MTLKKMLVEVLVPNTLFHVTTAYGILRMKGVPLGKLDFLAPFFKNSSV